MGQRNMLCTSQIDLEMDQQGQGYLHPEPCILLGGITNFPQPDIQRVVTASGNTANADGHHLPEHYENAIFYGMPQYHGVQHHPQHHVPNLDLGAAAAPNFYVPYMAPSSAISLSHGSRDHLPSSTNYGVIGVSADEYGTNNHFMDNARGSYKRKNAEGNPGNFQYFNASASSSSSATPLNARHPDGVAVMDAASFTPPQIQYRGSTPSIREVGSHRSVSLELGLQLHALIIKLGYLDCVIVANALMCLYGKNGCLDYASQLFDEMPQRDIATWNTVISNMVNELSYEKALELFRDLHRTTDFKSDQFTLSTVLTACAGCHAVMGGREVHAHSIRTGFERNLSINNAIIRFYTRCGSLKDVLAEFEMIPARDIITWTEMITAYMEFGFVDMAVEVFAKMPERNSVSYNALLSGFCKNGEGLKALDFFIKMVQEGVELTDFTLTSVINACGILMELDLSRQIHGFIIKFGFGSNAFIEAALLDMCTKCGRMNDAAKMFHRWPSDQDSLIIRTSMLCGYARNGMPDEAISLFQQSQSEGAIIMDAVALTSLLGVCGTLGFHGMGKQIHCHAFKTEFVADTGVGNSIISMYSKCFNMDDAIKSFNSMPAHDIVSWNYLIAGHLLHRQGDEALVVWSKMEKACIKPDTVTLILIISAYRHTSSNLVDNCRRFFISMKNNYDIEPTSEHYASLVSVLGHWGLLEEAEELIIRMPFEPEASVWRALLDSCRLHLNTSIGKRVAKRILAMEPKDPSTFVLVSNLYSASGRWHCSELVRANMRERGFQKQACRSWIINQEKVHSFYVRDKSHPQAKDIYSGLDILVLECLKAGYEPDTSFVLHEVEEHQKKDFLFYHSAKLAATYGLLTTRPGEPIRIVKNILLCGDCHSFLKYVSVVTRREIFVRDASGFHCFSNGQCSCKDYW